MRLDAVIFADGPPFPKSLNARLRRGRFTIVLDGAAEAVRKQGWLPHMVAGDFDDVSPSTLRYFEKKGVAILHTPDQDFTDLEKAIAWCVLRDCESIWIAQAFGGRVDHSFVNLSLLKRFHSPVRELVLFQENERVRFLRNQKIKLGGRQSRRLAVLPFPKCTVRSKGLNFEMRGMPLELGAKESASNSARLKDVTLDVEGEALVVEEISGGKK